MIKPCNELFTKRVSRSVLVSTKPTQSGYGFAEIYCLLFMLFSLKTKDLVTFQFAISSCAECSELL